MLIILLFPMVVWSAKVQVPELQNSENYLLIRLHYTNSSGEKGVTDFNYDSRGNICTSEWKLLNGKRSSFNQYSVDKNGLMIRKSRLFSDSLTTLQEFFYDPCGKLIRETYQRSDGTSGEVSYDYDQHGKLLRALCRNMNGWFSGTLKYQYNAYDVMDKAIIVQKGNEAGTIEYEYDINGNLKLEAWDFNGKWQQAFVYDYVEVPDNMIVPGHPFIPPSRLYRVESEYYSYTGGGEGPSMYDYKDNKLLKKTYRRSDGMITVTTYSYDSTGIPTGACRQYSDGKSADFFYTYNSDNRLVHRRFRRSDDLQGEERYFYDSQGRLAMAEFKKMDAWLSGTIAFSHNIDGLPSSGYFRGDDDFNAELHFQYDENKNLVKIRWDFSFGQNQEYTFKYLPMYQQEIPESPAGIQ